MSNQDHAATLRKIADELDPPSGVLRCRVCKMRVAVVSLWIHAKDSVKVTCAKCADESTPRQPAEGQSEAERASVYGCAPEDVQSGPRMMHGNLKYHFPYTYHPHAPHPETRECEARACQPVAAKPPRMMQGPRAQDGGWYKDHAGVHAYSPDCDEKPACQPVAPKPGKRRLDDAEFQRIASAYVSGFAESARASCVGLSPGPRKHVWAGIRALLKELGYEKGEL